MCGINGFSWEDQGLIQAMNKRLVHRGPDAHGEYVGGGASLGHTRLSIIDLSQRGRQPMVNEHGDVRIVVNGEIYNYLDLRKELIDAGHIFRSDSDSEVVLHGYEQWGPGGHRAHHRHVLLRGHWTPSVAVHHAGPRPPGHQAPLLPPRGQQADLQQRDQGAAVPGTACERRVDLPGLHQYLGYEYVPAPRTLFDGGEQAQGRATTPSSTWTAAASPRPSTGT